MIKKLPQWEMLLFNFLETKQDHVFKWGKWDCCILVIDAIEAMTGEKILKKSWSNKKEALMFIKENGKTLNKVASKYLKKAGLSTLDKAFITAGDIVLLEDSENNFEELMGVCTGNLIVCITDYGYTYRDNHVAKKVWRIDG